MPESSNKQFLFHRIAWRLQANVEGDLSERARRQAIDIVDDRDLRVRVPKEFVDQPDSGFGSIDCMGPPKDYRLAKETIRSYRIQQVSALFRNP
jgi:hypothetical protein